MAARQYGPLIGPEDLPREEALFFFLLNLTLRIRLDRLDGVGEIAYVQAGSRYSAPARDERGAPVANGQTVKIVRIVGSQFYVAPI